MFAISVPATLANLGPGFDVLGMAISIKNQFFFEPTTQTQFVEPGDACDPEQHVVFDTVRAATRRFGVELTHGLSLRQVESVPRARGLGSSATARVAGLCAWSHFTQTRPSLQAALELLTELEGHPDNVTPAMVGGLTICTSHGGAAQPLRLPPPQLSIALCIPDHEVCTQQARSGLPDQVAMSDATFNLSRMAMLMAGLLRGDPDSVRLGVADRLHQRHRIPLIGPVEEAFSAAVAAGALGAFVSGSGSTLAAWVDGDPAPVSKAMVDVFERSGIAATGEVARPEPRGGWESKRDLDAFPEVAR